MFPGFIATSPRMLAHASSSPTPPPMTESTTLSVSSWRTRLHRSAPSAVGRGCGSISVATKAQAENSEEVINEHTYIFEPSMFAVVAHLERSMLEIALSQTILESKLAQYASRFRSMTVAKDKATDSEKLTKLAYNRARRAIGDERLKETTNGLR